MVEPSLPKPTRVLPAGTIASLTVADGDIIEGAGADATCITAAPLVVPAGAKVRLQKLGLCGASGEHVVSVLGALEAEQVSVTGGRNGFRVEGAGSLVLTDASGDNGETFVSVLAGSATLLRTTATHMSASAYFVGAASFSAKDITANDCEYGLLARPGAALDVHGARFDGGTYAGVGLVGAGGVLADVVVDGRSKGGEGLMANDVSVPLSFDGLRLRNVRGNAVSLVRAPATLTNLAVESVATDADGTRGIGLYVQGATVSVAQSQIANAKGDGVVALEADVTLSDSKIERAVASGVSAYVKGTVHIVRSEVKGIVGPALVAIEGGTIDVQSGSITQAKGELASADCASGSAIVIAKDVVVSGQLGACVERR